MSNCKARQYSDQMQCVCGPAWDVNDPEPPECPPEPVEVVVHKTTALGSTADQIARVAEKTDRHVRNAGVGRRALDRLKEGLKDETHIPDVLYDGYAVYQALGPKARARTSPENVSDVLDAAVNLLRSRGHD